MMDQAGDLDRFLDAQREIHSRALAELRCGRKESHWMWFVFPQIAGLGISPMSRFYAIRDRDEARAYLAHPVLGLRLIEAVESVLGWAGKRSAEAIFGSVDAMKLRSSCTLFEAVDRPGGAFADCLDRFFSGERDAATLRVLE